MLSCYVICCIEFCFINIENWTSFFCKGVCPLWVILYIFFYFQIASVDNFVSSVNLTLKHRHDQERLASIITKIESYDAVEAPNDEVLKVRLKFHCINLFIPTNIYNYLCKSVSITTEVVSLNPTQVRCTRYNIMWSSLSVTCDRSVVSSGYSSFLNQKNWPPRYNWNSVERGIKHHKPNFGLWMLRFPDIYPRLGVSSVSSSSVLPLSLDLVVMI